MITVQKVEPMYVQQVWPMVELWIKPLFVERILSKYYSIDNLKDYIIRGEQTMLVGFDENQKLQGAVTIQWCNYPNARVAYVTTFGANIGKEIEIYAEFIVWLKSMGATRVEFTSKPSVARLLKNRMGFTASKLISMELEL